MQINVKLHPVIFDNQYIVSSFIVIINRRIAINEDFISSQLFKMLVSSVHYSFFEQSVWEKLRDDVQR